MMKIRPLVNSMVTKIMPNGDEVNLKIAFGAFIAVEKVVECEDRDYVDIYLKDGIIPDVHLDCIEIYGGKITKYEDRAIPLSESSELSKVKNWKVWPKKEEETDEFDEEDSDETSGGKPSFLGEG
jgi:hypothetical protein